MGISFDLLRLRRGGSNMKVLIILAVAALVACEKSPEEMGGMFEGDMEMNPDQMAALMEQMSKKNQFASKRSGLWKTNGRPDTIKYYIDPQISGATNVIHEAIRNYEEKTCLRFSKQRSRPRGVPHLFFTTGSGCSSPVGRYRSGNSIKLARGCWRKGTVMHEIGHSIGLFHEQSRPDRDNFVNILTSNINPRNKHNFNKYTTSRIDSRGTPYDYDSMMHYGGKFFSRNGRLTIQTKNSRDQGRIGQRGGFSATDKKQINLMYCGGSNSGGNGGSKPVCRERDFNRSCPKWKHLCGKHSYVIKYCRKTCKC